MAKIITEKPFVTLPPAAQNAVDMFAGEWSSRFPAGAPAVTGGSAGLFEDGRVEWAEAGLRGLGAPGFAGQAVLELGPLEGGHSYMLGRMGASEVQAVEANGRAYLKCLIAKEILGMGGVHFLLGDALAYLRANDRAFGAGVACAFLNHLVDPVEVIALLARACRQVFIWNVVYTPALFTLHPAMAARFGPGREAVHAGFRHTLYPHYYGEGVDYGKFVGGVEPSCCWMTAPDIVAALRHFGFERVVSREEDHLYGKAVAVVAAK